MLIVLLALMGSVASAENRALVFTSNCSYAPGAMFLKESTAVTRGLRKHGWEVRNLWESERVRTCTLPYNDPSCRWNDPRCCTKNYDGAKALQSLGTAAEKLGVPVAQLRPSTTKNLYTELEDAVATLQPGDQFLLVLETHGSGSPHSICTGDGVGGSLSIERNPELLKRTAAFRAKGVKLGVLDASCYGGGSLKVLSGHGCVMANIDANHVSYGSQSWGPGDAEFTGNVADVTMAETMLLSSAASLDALDVDGARRFTMEDLFLRQLSNGRRFNDASQISSASTGSWEASLAFSDWRREKGMAPGGGISFVFDKDSYTSQVVGGPLYDAVAAVSPPDPDTLNAGSYTTSFAIFPGIATLGAGESAAHLARASDWHRAFLNIGLMRDFHGKLAEGEAWMNAVSGISHDDAATRVRELDAGTRAGVGLVLEALRAARDSQVALEDALPSAEYALEGALPAGVTLASFWKAMRALPHSDLLDAGVFARRDQLLFGYAWDNSGMESILRASSRRLARAAVALTLKPAMLAVPALDAAADAISARIVEAEKAARAAMDPSFRQALTLRNRELTRLKMAARDAWERLSQAPNQAVATLRFLEYVARRERFRAGGAGLSAEERQRLGDCAGFTLFNR